MRLRADIEIESGYAVLRLSECVGLALRCATGSVKHSAEALGAELSRAGHERSELGPARELKRAGAKTKVPWFVHAANVICRAALGNNARQPARCCSI